MSQMTFNALSHGQQALSFQGFHICSKEKVAFTIISFQETTESFHLNDTLISARTLEDPGHPKSLQQSD